MNKNVKVYKTNFCILNRGLIELFGGKQEYTQFLDKSFEEGEKYDFVAKGGKNHASNWIDYGNQPGTAMAHLFNYSGAPWLSQKWVRKVKEAYGDITPYDGYKGDEDQGQMGALGMLMAMGLFQVDGGASENPYYEITSPLFDELTIHLNKDYYPGKKFVIKTGNNQPDNIYIQSAALNKKALDNCWFFHSEFARGGALELELGKEPNKEWGIKVPPPSLNLAEQEIVLTSSTVTVSIERIDKGYTIQNDKPVLIRIPISGTSVPGPLEIYENGKMIAKQEGIISRHKPNLVEYRLAKAYEKAIVVSKNID